MAFFGMGRSTVEWQESRPDLLFYKWKETEIKKGSHLIIRPGQKAVFYANGAVEGVFEQPGNFDIYSDILPVLSNLKGLLQLRGDTGLRAEVYFVNAKELLLNWGTRSRVLVPTHEAPGGVPVGLNGNLVIEFKDYLKFIERIAGVKQSYSLSDIAERIMGELNPILTEAILDGQTQIGLNVLASLQQNNRALARRIQAELDKELLDIGFGVRDFNIMAINYPPEVQQMIERLAAQSFIGDTGRYATANLAEGLRVGGNTDFATIGAQMQIGARLAEAMAAPQAAPSQAAPSQGAEPRFCTKCRKMVNSKFCPDCGTETV